MANSRSNDVRGMIGLIIVAVLILLLLVVQSFDRETMSSPSQNQLRAFDATDVTDEVDSKKAP